ncbi:MAG: DUF1049 domain-containing protein [Magnetococcales bacterium]|nr:DUF1049 domain-containing protein [Magnetococcales bacterium]
MLRLVVSLLAAVMLLIFASQNMHEVKVRFVFGPPIDMPMILAISGAFISGFALATLNFIARTGRKKDDDD